LPRQTKSGDGLTPLELEIMNVIWEVGGANVQTVQAHLEGRTLAYNTVQTVLNILHRKGKVKRRLKHRAYIYQPVLSRQRAIGQAISDMLDRFFDGSADRLVLNLIETRQISPQNLAKIQKLLKQPRS
jgi:BlaI family penicillinase repressor